MSVEDPSLQAQAWLARHLEEEGIHWDMLTASQRLLMTMKIPCSIRCWRVGVAIDVRGGEVCPECGKTQPKKTCWEIIPLPV